MRKQIVLGIVALWFMASCFGPKGKVIPHDKMVPIMVEIQLAEAEANNMNPLEGGKSFKVIKEYDRIYKKYGVQPEDFYTSFKYYEDNPAMMDTLFQEVTTELNRRESDLNRKINEAKKKKADSLKTLPQPRPNAEP